MSESAQTIKNSIAWVQQKHGPDVVPMRPLVRFPRDMYHWYDFDFHDPWWFRSVTIVLRIQCGAHEKRYTMNGIRCDMLQRTDKLVCNLDLEAADYVERVLQVHPILFERFQRVYEDPIFKEAIGSIALHLRFPFEMMDRGTVETDLGLLLKKNSIGQFLSHPNSYLAWVLGCKLSNVCELDSRQPAASTVFLARFVT